jgi:hypothetical protein
MLVGLTIHIYGESDLLQVALALHTLGSLNRGSGLAFLYPRTGSFRYNHIGKHQDNHYGGKQPDDGYLSSVVVKHGQPLENRL